MAAKPVKRGDKWFIQFRRQDFSRGMTFMLKEQAVTWERNMATAYDNDRAGIAGRQPYVAAVLEAFRDHQAPLLKGWKEARNAMDRLLTANPSWAKVRADRFGDVLRDWKVDRQTEVSTGSVRREFSFIASAFKWAMDRSETETKGGKPIKNAKVPLEVRVTMPNSPTSMCGKWPADGLSRTRIITREELTKIVGTPPRHDATTAMAYMPYIAWFARYTGLRMGEICQLTWGDLDVANKTVHVRDEWSADEGGKSVKNGSAREVPILPECMEMLLALSDFNEEEPEDALLFTMSKYVCDTHWREMRDKAGFKAGEIVFHDLRHTALTELSKIYRPEQLLKISGHTNFNILYNVYYKTTGKELAEDGEKAIEQQRRMAMGADTEKTAS